MQHTWNTRNLLATLLVTLSLAACAETTSSLDTTPPPTPTREIDATSQTSAAAGTPRATALLTLGTPRSNGEQPVRNTPAAPPPTQPPISRDSNFDSDGDGFYTYDELKRAVEARLPDYEFPPNYQVTMDTLMMSMAPFADAGARWEVPMEVAVLGNYHQCAWELTWLDAYKAGDSETMARSLEQLRTVTLNNPINAGGYDVLSEMFDRAELGDPVLIQHDVDSSCLMDWATPASPASSAISPANDGAIPPDQKRVR